MKITNKHITDSFLLEYIKGMLSPDQSMNVEHWLKADPGNKEHFEKIRKIWIHSSSFSSFNKIDSEKDWQLINDRLTGGKKVIMKPGNRSAFYAIARIAALAVILIGLGYLIYILAGERAIQHHQMVVQTTDQKATVDLTDGSKVFLNNGSSLFYPERFRNNIRKVELTGEAWFEIAEDKNKPFIISVDGAEIKVLGTSFNVHSDLQTGRIVVSVVNGRVSLYPKDNEKKAILLTAKEEGVFVADSISKYPVSNQNFISWKTGILHFDRTPLEDVMKSLGKHFHVTISFKNDTLQNKTLTSVYDNQSLEEVLGELKLLLGISYHYKSDTLVIQME